MLAKNKFELNVELMFEEAYFMSKDKVFYKKSMKMLDNRRNHSIADEGNFVDKQSLMLPKTFCFMSFPTDMLHNLV